MQRNTTGVNSFVKMAHLDKLPTYFVKGDDRRAVYFTVNAAELIAEGFVEENDESYVPTPREKTRPEVPVIAGKDAYIVEEIDDEEEEIELEEFARLEDFTKTELLEYARAWGKEIKSSLSKAEILELCKKFSD